MLVKVLDSIIGTVGDNVLTAEPAVRGGETARTGLADVAQAMAALRAFASMARLSQRHQAEVEAALHRSGLAIDGRRRDAILRYLADEGCVDGQIPLSDGAMILTVTAIGMTRAGLG